MQGKPLILSTSLALLLPLAAQAQMPPVPVRPAYGAQAPVIRASVVAPVTYTTAPPPPRAEVRTAAPSANHVWIDGHWALRGNRQEWLGGHWALPPGKGYGWEPARWDRDGDRYAFREGHWRSTVVPAPQVVYQPAPPPQPLYAPVAPPAPVVELRGVPPFVGAAWIPGYWTWHGSHHVWVGGQWSAPMPRHDWQEGRWHQEKAGWRHEDGRWREHDH